MLPPTMVTCDPFIDADMVLELGKGRLLKTNDMLIDTAAQFCNLLSLALPMVPAKNQKNIYQVLPGRGQVQTHRLVLHQGSQWQEHSAVTAIQ